MSFLDVLHAQLVVDEGNKSKPYTDTVGKVTIGIGRNLTDVGLSQDEINLLCNNDMTRAVKAAQLLFPTFSTLSDNRKAALCNMAFNLGQQRLAEFHSLINSVNVGNFGAAGDAMLSSLWATQVGDRAKRLANLMRSG